MESNPVCSGPLRNELLSRRKARSGIHDTRPATQPASITPAAPISASASSKSSATLSSSAWVRKLPLKF